MKYLIIEIQTSADGNVATIVTEKDNLNEAFSVFYSVLSAAAVSSVPLHAAVLMTNNGAAIKREVFDHTGVSEV